MQQIACHGPCSTIPSRLAVFSVQIETAGGDYILIAHATQNAARSNGVGYGNPTYIDCDAQCGARGRETPVMKTMAP